MIAVTPLLSTGLEVLIPPVLFLLLLHFIVVGWGYNDAKGNSTLSPYLWAVVLFALPIAGILTYLHLERDGLPAEVSVADQANRSS